MSDIVWKLQSLEELKKLNSYLERTFLMKIHTLELQHQQKSGNF